MKKKSDRERRIVGRKNYLVDKNNEKIYNN